MSNIIYDEGTIPGCGKKFWTCFYGSSMLGYFAPIVGWHKVKCGNEYLVEGLALCKDCRNNLLDKRSKKLDKILKGSFFSKAKKKGVING